MADFYSEAIGADGAYKFYVNGEWRTSSSGKILSVSNPSTNTEAFRVQGAARSGWVGSWHPKEACLPLHRAACARHLADIRSRAPPRPPTACTPAEVDEAFAAAKAAQKSWAKTPL